MPGSSSIRVFYTTPSRTNLGLSSPIIRMCNEFNMINEYTMKALVQRVMNAKVIVNGETISCIEQGICVFIGICNNDTKKDIEYIIRKILNTKLFDDESNKKWKKSVVDKELEVLCVSQFTLYNTWKGNKPDFHNTMPGDKSKEFYENFIKMLKDAYRSEKIKDGQFGAYMQVCIQNDGPVTFEIESPKIQGKEAKSRGKADAKVDSLLEPSTHNGLNQNVQQ